MKTHKTLFQSITRATTLVIPAPFICPGCLNAIWEGVCRSCIRSIRRTSEMLASPSEEIEGIFPILYSFQDTHALLKNWKDHPGHLTERILFRLHPALKKEITAHEFDWIIPIPQTFHRSWRRGHESAKTVAQFFSRQTEVPILNALQLKNESTPRQASLTQWQREIAPNPFSFARETFEHLNQKRDLKIMIVDDLITSGNTVIRAAEELKLHVPHIKIWAGSLGYRPKRLQKYH